MTYFNFTKVTPAAPNDPKVNVTTHLNNNWDHLETQLHAIQLMPQNLTGAEQGQEWVTDNPVFRVWDGSNNRDPDDIDSGWSAWTALPLSANVIARTGFTPRYQTNTLTRAVRLAGGIQKDAGASAWIQGALVVITNAALGLSSSFAPVGGNRFQTAAAIPSTGGAGGWHLVDTSGSFVRIQTAYVGGPGGGNFVMLDGIQWWY